LDGSEQCVEHGPRAGLAKQVLQTLLGESADFTRRFAFGFGANDAEQAVVLAALCGLFARAAGAEQARRGPAAHKRHAGWFGDGALERGENQRWNMHGQDALPGANRPRVAARGLTGWLYPKLGNRCKIRKNFFPWPRRVSIITLWPLVHPGCLANFGKAR